MKSVERGLVLWLLLLAVSVTGRSHVAAAETNTLSYNMDSFGPSDDGSAMHRYADFLWTNHTKFRAGQAGPLPEELPSHLDTNGNWGLEVCGFQLGIRFQQSAFRVGDPVIALVYIRNISSSSDAVVLKRDPASKPRQNFRFALTHGETTNYWSWTRPVPSHPFFSTIISHGVPRNSQLYFIVRVDEMFDVSKAGEYLIQAQWPVQACRMGTVQIAAGTNVARISTGFAKFRVVEKP